MPNYKGHLVGALGAYAAAVLLFSLTRAPVPVLAQGLLFTCLGGLFPDIDTKSKGQKIFYIFFVCAIIGLIVYQQYHLLAFTSLMGSLPLLVSHRGLFHNIWFMFVLIMGSSIVLVSLFPSLSASIVRNGCFFSLGVFSHLLLDFGFMRVFRLR